MRGGKPFVFTNCKTGKGIPELVALIETELLFDRHVHSRALPASPATIAAASEQQPGLA